MTKISSVTAFLDDTSSWATEDSFNYTGGSKATTNDNATEATDVDLKLRCEFLEIKLQSQADMLAKLDEKVDKLSEEKRQVTASLQDSQTENKKLVEKVETLVRQKEALSAQLKDLQKAKKDTEIPNEGVRSKKAVWMSSLDKCATATSFYLGRSIDMLNGPVLRSGKTKWKIAVHVAEGLRLGVVSAGERNFSNRVLGERVGTWGYGGWGDAWSCGKQVGGQHFSYGKGSIITFILDLTGKGTLSAAVDDKPFIKLFSNMKSVATEFVPAIYLYNNSKVEFLGFE